MNELKPCPFCGHKLIRLNPIDTSIAGCKKCYSFNQIPLWNTRPIEDALNNQIEKLKAENTRLTKRVEAKK